MDETGKLLPLRGIGEVEALIEGLDSLNRKDVVITDLKRRLEVASRYFKQLNPGYEKIQQAAANRNRQRRRDGRG